MIEGSLEVKLLTIWTDGKAEVGRVREEKSRREKMQVRVKVAKPRNTVFFQWFVAPGGRKVGSLKRRVRSHVARWEMRKCTPLWREAHFQVKMYTTHQGRTTFGSWDVEEVHAVVVRRTFPSQNVHHSQTTFGSWDVEKVHAVVAWSKFRSQNVKSTTCSDQFWTFRCRFAWLCCLFVPCGVCLFWRHRMCCLNMSVLDVCSPFSCLSFLTVRSRGRCSLRAQTEGKKGRVVHQRDRGRVISHII